MLRFFRGSKKVYLVNYQISDAAGRALESTMYLNEKNDCRAVFYLVHAAENLVKWYPGCNMKILEIKTSHGVALDFSAVFQDHVCAKHLFRRCPIS